MDKHFDNIIDNNNYFNTALVFKGKTRLKMTDENKKLLQLIKYSIIIGIVILLHNEVLF